MSSLEKAGGGEGQCLVSHMFAAEPKSPCERSLGPQAPGLRPFGGCPKTLVSPPAGYKKLPDSSTAHSKDHGLDLTVSPLWY